MPPCPIFITVGAMKKYGTQALGFYSSAPIANSGGLNTRKKHGKTHRVPRK